MRDRCVGGDARGKAGGADTADEGDAPEACETEDFGFGELRVEEGGADVEFGDGFHTGTVVREVGGVGAVAEGFVAGFLGGGLDEGEEGLFTEVTAVGRVVFKEGEL